MQIDLFTLVAEVVNFLILVWLLQRFLYRPIVNAMQEREQKIADQLDNAENTRQRAEEEERKYQQLQKELEAQREDKLQQAREEANERRKVLIEQAREESDDLRRNWQMAVQQEKESFLNEFEQQIGESAVQIARQALADMASIQLEKQVVGVFVKRLQDSEADRENIKDTLRDQSLEIESTFELSDSDRSAVEDVLDEVYDVKETPNYKVIPELICGIRISTGAHQIGWTFSDYTATLRKHFLKVIDDATRKESEDSLQHESEQ